MLLLGCQESGPNIPEDSTFGVYDPLESLTTFPDDVQTVDDPTTPTGRRVQLQDGPRAELQAQIPDSFNVLEAVEELDGFGTLAPVMLRFDAPIDIESVREDTVWWVSLSDGQAVAWEAQLSESGLVLFLFPQVPLREATRYGVALSGITDTAGERVYAAQTVRDILNFEPVAPEVARVVGDYAALRLLTGLAPEDIAAATVFTTQSLTAEDAAITALLDAHAPTLTVTDCAGTFCAATLSAVDLLGADGRLQSPPTVEQTYSLPVDLYLPSTPAPWPVLIYGHGLGGDRHEGDPAAMVADLGVAVLTVDAPAHGDHPSATSDNELDQIVGFFGIDLFAATFDVYQLRDHWRQAAWDKLQLIRAVQAGVDLDGDGAADLDSSRIAYGGHSLGGIMGPDLLSMAPEVGAAYLSVPGGRVAYIVAESPTFAPLIAAMRPAGVSDDDVSRFFPLLQTAIERGDPANRAPAVLNGQRDVLMNMVIDDQIIPNRANAILARALGVGLASPVLLEIPGLESTGTLPISGNHDGRTAILYQYDTFVGEDGSPVTATHEDAYDNPLPAEQAHHFFQTWLESGLAEVK